MNRSENLRECRYCIPRTLFHQGGGRNPSRNMERKPELQTDRENPINIVVAPDYETFEILSTEPNDLVNKLFENDKEKVFLLKGSGFSMDRQVLRWMIRYKEALEKEKEIHTTMNEFINETIQDVIGFYYEYLTGQDIFKIDLEFKMDKDGLKDVYATKYNTTLREVNKNMKVILGETEREGALEDGVDQAIDKMISAGPNAIVFLVSPSGWSGLKRDGKDIIYPDNQTYVYWINTEGNLEGLTIRTNISLETSESLTKSDKKDKSYIERIKNVVRSPVSMSATSMEAVLDLIEEVSGKEFAKQRYELVNRDQLFTLNTEATRIIENLRSYLLANITVLNKESVKLFAKNVGRAILDLRKQVLDDQRKVKQSPLSTSNEYTYHNHYLENVFYNDAEMYYQLANDVSKLKGCNGGGVNQDRFIPNSLYAGFFGTNNIAITDSKCQVCGTTEDVACGWCKTCWTNYGTGA